MVKVDNENEATARLEAALYSSGRPLSIEDLIRASGTESRTKTLNLLTKLMQKTKSTFKAIEITNLPDGSYVFQLKPEYSAASILAVASFSLSTFTIVFFALQIDLKSSFSYR